MADGTTTRTAVLDSANDETGWLAVNQGQGFLAQVSATALTATVELQYRADAGSPISTVKSYTAQIADIALVAHAAGEVRLICTAFTSATAGVLRIAPGAYMGR